MQANLDEEEHELKWRKEFESWGDLEELTKARIVKGNCRRGDEGPSNLFVDVWHEIWEDDLEKAHKKKFYSK